MATKTWVEGKNYSSSTVNAQLLIDVSSRNHRLINIAYCGSLVQDARIASITDKIVSLCINLLL